MIIHKYKHFTGYKLETSFEFIHYKLGLHVFVYVTKGKTQKALSLVVSPGIQRQKARRLIFKCAKKIIKEFKKQSTKYNHKDLNNVFIAKLII